MGKSSMVVGAKVVCYINNKPFARVADFSYTSQTPRKEIRGIDCPTPYELAPTITGVSGQVSVWKLSGDGGLEGSGITANFNDLVREKYFTITLIERDTDRLLFRADQCSVSAQSWHVPTKGIMTGQFSFQGILWTNEVT